jgi:hypothetical protein
MAKMCTNRDLNYAFNLDLGDLNKCPTKYQAESQSMYKISVDSAYNANQLFPINAAFAVQRGCELVIQLNTNFIESYDYQGRWYGDYYTQYGVYGFWSVMDEQSDYMNQVFGNGSQLEVGREYEYTSSVRVPNPFGTGLEWHNMNIDEFGVWIGESDRAPRRWTYELYIGYTPYIGGTFYGWNQLSGYGGPYGGYGSQFESDTQYLDGNTIPSPVDRYEIDLSSISGWPTDDAGVFILQIRPIRPSTY